ncbi:MAG: hypothetical protein V4717_11740 [Bacteroidota bacterium]
MKKPGFFQNAYFLLFLVLVIAYFPVSSLYFGLKNDAFSDNFPIKYFLTASLRSGFSPLWNPYLNFGFPIYADPGFAFWSPVTWFFGAVLGYNAYTFTIEVLLYIYLAGAFMHRLLSFLGIEKKYALAAAVMYMCSGFFCGEIQHVNYLTAAAFLPFLMQSLLQLSAQPSLRNAIVTAFGYYAIFACGHPAMPIGLIYFLSFLYLGYLINRGKAGIKLNKPFYLYHLLAFLFFVALFMPAIYSYISIVQDYVRNQPLVQSNETNLGFSPKSYLSFLLPFATANGSGFFDDDLSMRNAYFSMAGLISVAYSFKSKSVLVRSLFIAAAGMLVLSCGGAIKAFIYSILPGLGYLRTNGEFRVYTIFCCCLIGAFGFREIVENGFLRNCLRRFLIVAIILFILLFFISFSSISSLLSNHSKISVDSLSFSVSTLISVGVQTALVCIFLMRKASARNLMLFVIFDMMINCFIFLPMTGVGRTKLSEINAVFRSFPKGIPIPPLQPIQEIDRFNFMGNGLLGSYYFYSKKIGAQSKTTYPSMFLATRDYFESEFPKELNKKPFIFLKKEPGVAKTNLIRIMAFSPTNIVLSVSSDRPDSLVLLQNFTKKWSAEVNETKVGIKRSYLSFMSVPISKGTHLVRFHYSDPWLIFFIIASFCMVVGLLFVLFFQKLKYLPGHN